MQNGEPLAAVTRGKAIDELLTWPSVLPGPVILDGHNMRAFDSRILLNEVERSQLSSQLADAVAGFADSLLAFRAAYPGQFTFLLDV